MVYIYFLSSSLEPNNIRYIGKTHTLVYRLKKHLDSHRLKVRLDYKNSWIKSVLGRGGKILINELDYVPEQEWRFWEQHYISLYKSWGFKLTNSDMGGYGNDITKEVIEKGRLKRIGKKRTPEQCQRISEACKGRKLSQEAIKNRLGKSRPLEVRLKISINNSKHNSKPVKQFCVDSGVLLGTFPNMSEALRKIKGNSSGVSAIQRVCDNIPHHKSAFGFRWEWA